MMLMSTLLDFSESRPEENALSENVSEQVNRRQFVSSALTLSGTAVAASMLGSSHLLGAATKSLDPIDPCIRFGITGALWGCLAHDFLAPCGCDHWKTNMGTRPQGVPSEDQLKMLAATLNEIGRQTIAFGVRLAPIPISGGRWNGSTKYAQLWHTPIQSMSGSPPTQRI
jgi:hypothetical protein